MQNPVEDVWLQGKNFLRKMWQLHDSFSVVGFLLSSSAGCLTARARKLPERPLLCSMLPEASLLNTGMGVVKNFISSPVSFQMSGDIIRRGLMSVTPVGHLIAPSVTRGTIFVKLWQMELTDQTRVVIDSTTTPWYPGLIPGLSVVPLHQFGTENVALVKWEPGLHFQTRHWGGERKSLC